MDWYIRNILNILDVNFIFTQCIGSDLGGAYDIGLTVDKNWNGCTGYIGGDSLVKYK